MGQDDGHHAFVLEEVETVQQEGKIGGGLGGQAVILKPYASSPMASVGSQR